MGSEVSRTYLLHYPYDVVLIILIKFPIPVPESNLMRLGLRTSGFLAQTEQQNMFKLQKNVTLQIFNIIVYTKNVFILFKFYSQLVPKSTHTTGSELVPL